MLITFLKSISRIFLRAMAQQLKALVALPSVSGSNPNSHEAAQNHLQLKVQRIQHLLCPPQHQPHTHSADIHAGKHHIYKIMIFFFNLGVLERFLNNQEHWLLLFQKDLGNILGTTWYLGPWNSSRGFMPSTGSTHMGYTRGAMQTPTPTKINFYQIIQKVFLCEFTCVNVLEHLQFQNYINCKI